MWLYSLIKWVYYKPVPDVGHVTTYVSPPERVNVHLLNISVPLPTLVKVNDGLIDPPGAKDLLKDAELFSFQYAESEGCDPQVAVAVFVPSAVNVYVVLYEL